MKKKIITIHEERYNGCGVCASAYYEGAVGIVDEKAELLGDHYYDGLGDCLPSCLTGAITLGEREAGAYDEETMKNRLGEVGIEEPDKGPENQFKQRPVRIKLLPVTAPYYRNRNFLIAADCTAFTYRNFHDRFMKGHVTVTGRLKLDNKDCSGELAEIIKKSEIKTIAILRMEVPRCRGTEMAAGKAMEMSGRNFPRRVVVVSTEGKLLPSFH